MNNSNTPAAKDDTSTVIAQRIGLENIGCEELSGYYLGFRFYWVPRTGVTRLHGSAKPVAHNATQKDLLLWVLANA